MDKNSKKRGLDKMSLKYLLGALSGVVSLSIGGLLLAIFIAKLQKFVNKRKCVHNRNNGED